MTPVRIAALWAADYWFAARGLVAAALPGPGPDAYLEAGRHADRPVLIVPGVWETWQFLRPTVRRLHAAGFPVHVMTELGRNSGAVAAAARQVADYLRHRDLTEVTIVAHSKGGLIGKYAMALLDPDRRITDMVAISTPFSGSWYARWIPLPSIHAFAPADPTTRLLARHTAVNRRITSIWAGFDPHIPGGSRLPGATNVRLPDVGHFRILGTARLQAAVDAALDRP